MKKTTRIGFLSLSTNGVFISFNENERAIDNAIKAFKGYKSKKKMGNLNFQSALAGARQVPQNIIDSLSEQYALIPFRLLSATTVGSGSWQSTKFSEEVLQKAMNKLINKPVYRDHYMIPDYWAGIVEQVSFTREDFQDNIRVPAGIDGLLRLSTASEMNRNLVEGIQNKSINSNSVGIYFQWEMSHEFEHEHDFYWHIGETLNGEEVTRVVTHIIDFAETSIVGMGADPYAKQIGENGELINIDLAGSGEGWMEGFVNKSLKQIAAEMDEEERKAFEEKVKAEFSNSDSSSSLFKFGKVSKVELGEDKEDDEDMMDEDEEDDMMDEDEDEEMDMSNLCQRLDTLVKERCETMKQKRKEVVEEMANACGCSTATIYRVLNGKKACPSREMLQKIAGILLTNEVDLLQHAEKDGCDYTGTYSKADAGANKQLQDKVAKLEKTLADLTLGKSDVEKELEKTLTDNASLKADVKKLKDRKDQLLELTTKQSVVIENHRLDKKEWEDKKETLIVENTTMQLEAGRKDSEIDKLTAEVSKLQSTNKSLVQSNKQLVDLAKENEVLIESGKEYMDSLKAECLKLYKSTVKSPKDDVINLINDAKSVSEVNALLESYGHKKGNQFSFSCAKCGSDQFAFSSVKTDTSNKQRKQSSVETLTDDEIMRRHE